MNALMRRVWCYDMRGIGLFFFFFRLLMITDTHDCFRLYNFIAYTWRLEGVVNLRQLSSLAPASASFLPWELAMAFVREEWPSQFRQDR